MVDKASANQNAVIVRYCIQRYSELALYKTNIECALLEPIILIYLGPANSSKQYYLQLRLLHPQ